MKESKDFKGNRKMKLQHNSFLSNENIKIVEEKYKAHYVLDTALRTKQGRFTDFPIAIFYREELNEKEIENGYSNYFGIYQQGKKTIITDGKSVEDLIFTGLLSKNNEVAYSRYLHDFVSIEANSDNSNSTVVSEHEKVYDFIDGGRDYVRCSNPDKLVKFVVKDGQIIFSHQK